MITVPKTDVAASGLTIHDVTIYHYLADYSLWVPLETLKIMQDSVNYYYTAATDGASPFGVLIMWFGTEGDESAATPGFGVLMVLVGFGAAGVLVLRRR